MCYDNYVRKTKLPKRELDICRRLKEARESCNLTQEGCASQIGIDRSTLVNYESGRSPVRYEIGLRFCRNLVFNEEWLATGKFDILRKIAIEKYHTSASEVTELCKLIFPNQCVDLLSEPASLHIPPGTLFSEAFDKFLIRRYEELVSRFYYAPRIVFSEADVVALGLRYLNVMNRRYMIILRKEAVRLGKNGNLTEREFVRCVRDATELIFTKMLGFRLSADRLNDLDWLKYCVSDPNAVLGSIHARTPEPKQTVVQSVSS